MQYLDLTLSGAAENLALDEALLDDAEAKGEPRETLRIWEPKTPMVVVGRSSRVGVEVQVDACRRLGIPVLRRPSGGAAILTGPGCMMYAVVLSYQIRPELRLLDTAHRWVLDALVGALDRHVPGVRCRGTSDLAIGDRKFSGNSARCRREHLLYHGTLLYDLPLRLVGECLGMPPRMPEYRMDRTHEEFLANLPLPRETLRLAVLRAFGADEARTEWPQERTAKLAAEKYESIEWNDIG
ncbi:MAG: lipoate--protein ligase family protein [Thermoguttaceae bacterium]